MLVVTISSSFPTGDDDLKKARCFGAPRLRAAGGEFGPAGRGPKVMAFRAYRQSCWIRVLAWFPLLIAFVSTAGCLGPAAVKSTRMRYNESVRSTNDEQLLMNLVRLRYADSPVFIDLPSITSQFELAAGGSDPGPIGEPDQLRRRRTLGTRHADTQLPPAPGAGDRQGTPRSALGRAL